jgi:hypothetical protein
MARCLAPRRTTASQAAHTPVGLSTRSPQTLDIATASAFPYPHSQLIFPAGPADTSLSIPVPSSAYHRNSHASLSNLRVLNALSGKTPADASVSHYITSPTVPSPAPHDRVFEGSTTGEYAARCRVQSHDPHDGQCESPDHK